ncbi:MAG: cyclodeaminase/cyclohydrolase family protein [Oscillospiraceae bacterium]
MKLVYLKVNEFVDILSSDAPAPGGGSAAALEGALGIALTKMVAALTIGKKKYAEFGPLMMENLSKAEELKREFVEVIDRDTESFNAVSAVFSMPKETEKEKLSRKMAMQRALKGSTKPPFEMMELCLAALELTETMLGKSNQSAASDLGVCALSLKAAVQGAWLNVLINIGGINDEEFANEYRKNGEEILEKALPLADKIYAEILKQV